MGSHIPSRLFGRNHHLSPGDSTGSCYCGGRGTERPLERTGLDHYLPQSNVEHFALRKKQQMKENIPRYFLINSLSKATWCNKWSHVLRFSQQSRHFYVAYCEWAQSKLNFDCL